ncbi:hypothetical protein [Smaragdicoccus niigatensis]|uniref:hypothetical protein n=1 Tax=Smaragdicoccus niigatensis TaxID=359359 RepID=UPI00037FADE1|nr:hypothetical protein [Smaragdicoccus niigatensis]
MSSPGSGLVRLARTAVLASVMISLAAASHVLAGGHEPESWAFLPATVVALGASYAVTFTRTNLLATFGVLSLAQFGFHSIAEWCPPWCTDPMDHMAEHASSSGMTAGHLTAAFLTALVVAYGDQLLWTLWRWVTRDVRVAARIALDVEHVCAPIFFARPVPASRPASGALSRRGPPLFPAFV